MRSAEQWPSPRRRARFESFEQRLAPTAQPLSDLVLDAGEQLEHSYGELTPLLADVHAMAGVDYAHKTYGLDGRGQTVAIIDSGIAYDHVCLGSGFGSGYRVVGGWDFAENDGDPYDDAPAGFHGTHVAGIVASDHAAYVGVAPEVDLVALRVFNDQGTGYLTWVESALQWVHQNRNAFANPITTVNLSLGTQWNSDQVPSWSTLEDEFAQLKADGIFTVVAAGNAFADYGVPGLSYPAASPDVVPAASVDNDGSLSYFSQRSPRVLAAPGRSITSTVPDHVFGADGILNDFGTASGTSMAAPYVAGAGVLLRQAMEQLGYKNITQDTLYNHLYATADVIHDAATGLHYHRIDVRAAIDALVPQDGRGSSGEVRVSPPPSRVDLGPVEYLQLEHQQVQGEKWYQLASARDGILTVETPPGGSPGSVQLQLYDGSCQLLADGSPSAGGQRLDVPVAAGARFYLRLTGSSTGVDLRLANLVSVQGNELTVFGTAGRDAFLVDAAQGRVAVNEVSYQATAFGPISSIAVFGGGARDDFVFYGTSGDEQATLRPGSAQIAARDYAVRAASVESIQVFARGGQDVLTLFDSAANNTLVVERDAARLSGPGFSNAGWQFERVYAYANAGGQDVAHLYDSAGNDRLQSRGGIVSLSGSGYYNHVQQFEKVYAYATAGGQDIAALYDSPGDDTLLATSSRASLSGGGSFTEVQRFDRVYAYATAGGLDVARLYDSPGNDTLTASGSKATLSGSGFYNAAQQFERVYAYATSGGSDTARFYDSAGNDAFEASRFQASLRGSGFSNEAQQFERVYAYATRGGWDTATYYYTPGVDTFSSTAPTASLSGPNFTASAERFERVLAVATASPPSLARWSESVAGSTLAAPGSHPPPDTARADVLAPRSEFAWTCWNGNRSPLGHRGDAGTAPSLPLAAVRGTPSFEVPPLGDKEFAPLADGALRSSCCAAFESYEHDSSSLGVASLGKVFRSAIYSSAFDLGLLQLVLEGQDVDGALRELDGYFARLGNSG